MIRVCCSSFHIGDRKFGEKLPMEDKSETHGFCFSCFAKEKEDIERQLKEMKEFNNDRNLKNP